MNAAPRRHDVDAREFISFCWWGFSSRAPYLARPAL